MGVLLLFLSLVLLTCEGSLYRSPTRDSQGLITTVPRWPHPTYGGPTYGGPVPFRPPLRYVMRQSHGQQYTSQHGGLNSPQHGGLNSPSHEGGLHTPSRSRGFAPSTQLLRSHSHGDRPFSHYSPAQSSSSFQGHRFPETPLDHVEGDLVAHSASEESTDSEDSEDEADTISLPYSIGDEPDPTALSFKRFSQQYMTSMPIGTPPTGCFGCVSKSWEQEREFSMRAPYLQINDYALITSDVDDTLACPKAIDFVHAIAGNDRGPDMARKEVYPGVVSLMWFLSHHGTPTRPVIDNWSDESGLYIVSARPRGGAAPALLASIRETSQRCSDFVHQVVPLVPVPMDQPAPFWDFLGVFPGSLSKSSMWSHELMGAKKLKQLLKVRGMKRPAKFVWFGDTGQGDVCAAVCMISPEACNLEDMNLFTDVVTRRVNDRHFWAKYRAVMQVPVEAYAFMHIVSDYMHEVDPIKAGCVRAALWLNQQYGTRIFFFGQKQFTPGHTVDFVKYLGYAMQGLGSTIAAPRVQSTDPSRPDYGHAAELAEAAGLIPRGSARFINNLHTHGSTYDCIVSPEDALHLSVTL